MPNKRAIIKYIVPIGIIVISILFFKFMLSTKPSPKIQVVEERSWSVESQIVEKSDNVPVFETYGEVITRNDIQITAFVEATVIKRHVNLGDKVTKNQKLLSLDKSRLQQTVYQVDSELSEINAIIQDEIQQFNTDKVLLKHEKSLLKIANNAVKRTKTLKNSQMASGSQIDDAKRAALQQKIAITRLKATIANHPSRLIQLNAKKTQAKARLVLAKDDLAHSDIMSPISGVITKITVDEGEIVRKGNALFSISDTAYPEIRSLLPPKLYRLLNQAVIDDKTVIAHIFSNNSTLTAELTRLPNHLTNGLAGSYAFFKIQTLNDALIIGETVKIYVDLPLQMNSIVLPHDAIYGTDSVFLIKESRLKRVKIEWLGESYINNQKAILIRSEQINSGDEILINKFANAIEGLKVKSTNQPVINNEK